MVQKPERLPEPSSILASDVNVSDASTRRTVIDKSRESFDGSNDPKAGIENQSDLAKTCTGPEMFRLGTAIIELTTHFGYISHALLTEPFRQKREGPLLIGTALPLSRPR
jgi:hypothetical protein